MSDRPDWVQPGQRVAIISDGWRGSVSFDTITRILKRDIVLESGRRFAERFGDIRELGRSNSYYRAARLALPEDEAVLAIQQELRVASARSATAAAYDTWWRNPSVEKADALSAAVTAWVELQATP